MKNKEESLNALTTIYTTILQEIIHYSNEADNEGGKLINACIPVVTVFVGLNIFSDVFTESYLQMTIIIVILLFFFALYSIAQRSFQGHTYVALLRRQASILEYEINKRLGDEEGKYPILYNHEYISKYIAARQQMDLKIGNRIIKSSHMKYVFLDDEVEAFEMEKESLLETLREEDYGEVIESDLDVFVKPALNYYNHIIDLSDRFNISLFRWVKEVDHTIVSICNKLVSEEDSEKIKLINLLPDDFFADSDYIVNFNYSDTIEHLYLKEVFHIHGCCRASHPPIMGHAEDPFTMRYYDDRTLTLVKKFYKKSEDIMNRNIDFFNKLSDVNEIIVLGLGYTNTDYCYFDKINKICPDAKWTLYYYRDKDKKNAELYVEKLGLKSNQIKEYVSIKEKSPYIQKMYY